MFTLLPFMSRNYDRVAGELGANKIALGHHRDDMIETLFLNIFFGGKLKAMPPKLVTDKGDHVVIRPLTYCAEKDIASFARTMKFPIIPMQPVWCTGKLATPEHQGNVSNLGTSVPRPQPIHLYCHAEC